MARQVVKAPALRKARNGLVDVANKINVTGTDEDGVTFTPHGCQAIFGHVPFCPSDEKSPYWDCPPAWNSTSYLIEMGLQWSMMDMGADPKAILKEAMDIGLSPVLERLTWEGVAAVPFGTPILLPTLAGTVATVGITGRVMTPPAGAINTQIPPTLLGTQPGGTPPLNVGSSASIPQAIGMLEAKFLDASDHIAGGGTIFMSPIIGAQAGEAVDRDQMITRATESAVIIGNFDADQIIGVIGDVDVYLGEFEVIEANVVGTNEWVGRAEQRALAVWNPCGVFSVAIT
jgi:hypothetical protein